MFRAACDGVHGDDGAKIGDNSTLVILNIITIRDHRMELLKDPGNTRICKGLPLPPSRPLKSELLFQKNGIQIGLLK